MPSLADYEGMPINILLMGNSGVGKSSACASLANHGYEVGILDLDGHPQSILDPKVVAPENRSKIYIEQISLNDPNGYAKCLHQITKGNWGGWGPPSKWPRNRIFVLDSGTYFTAHALTASLIDLKYDLEKFYKGEHDKGRDAIKIYQTVGMRSARAIAQMCSFDCPFIATFHIREGEDINRRPYRRIATEGSRAAQEIPKLFGDMWEVALDNKGNRYIETKADSVTMRKNSLPSFIDDKIPLDLGEVFTKFNNVLRGELE